MNHEKHLSVSVLYTPIIGTHSESDGGNMDTEGILSIGVESAAAMLPDKHHTNLRESSLWHHYDMHFMGTDLDLQ